MSMDLLSCDAYRPFRLCPEGILKFRRGKSKLEVKIYVSSNLAWMSTDAYLRLLSEIASRCICLSS